MTKGNDKILVKFALWEWGLIRGWRADRYNCLYREDLQPRQRLNFRDEDLLLQERTYVHSLSACGRSGLLPCLRQAERYQVSLRRIPFGM